MIFWFLLAFTFSNKIRSIVFLFMFVCVFSCHNGRNPSFLPFSSTVVDRNMAILSIDDSIACMNVMKMVGTILWFSNHRDLHCAFRLSFRIIHYIDQLWEYRKGVGEGDCWRALANHPHFTILYTNLCTEIGKTVRSAN